jgi:hypothetical protein
MIYTADYDSGKWEIRPLVRKVVLHRETRSCHIVSNVWLCAPDGTGHQDGLIDRLP